MCRDERSSHDPVDFRLLWGPLPCEREPPQLVLTRLGLLFAQCGEGRLEVGLVLRDALFQGLQIAPLPSIAFSTSAFAWSVDSRSSVWS